MKTGYLLTLVAAGFLVTACNDDSTTSTNQPPSAQPVSTVTSTDQEDAVVWPGTAPADVETIDNLTQDNFVVVADFSGSMGDQVCSGNYINKSEAAKSVLNRWVDKLPQDSGLGLVVFDGNGVRSLVDINTGVQRQFKNALQAMQPSGGTPLNSSVTLAYNKLKNQAYKQRGFGSYKVVVITDGAHSPGENPTSIVYEITENFNNPVELYTIGFCIDDSALNSPGRTFYQSASDPNALEQGLGQVLAESDDLTTVETFFND